MEFARAWGFGGLCIGNLFAFRAQDKKKMMKPVEPIGPDNDAWLARLAAKAGIVVAAWGNDGSFMGRAEHVLRLLGKVSCLRVTQLGQPEHPLYLPSGLSPQPFASK